MHYIAFPVHDIVHVCTKSLKVKDSTIGKLYFQYRYWHLTLLKQISKTLLCWRSSSGATVLHVNEGALPKCVCRQRWTCWQT